VRKNDELHQKMTDYLERACVDRTAARYAQNMRVTHLLPPHSLMAQNQTPLSPFQLESIVIQYRFRIWLTIIYRHNRHSCALVVSIFRRLQGLDVVSFVFFSHTYLPSGILVFQGIHLDPSLTIIMRLFWPWSERHSFFSSIKKAINLLSFARTV
jgi:hypothetical protein